VAPVLRARNSTEFTSPQQQEAPGLGATVGAGNGNLRRFYKEGEIPDGMGAVQVRTRPKGATITVDERMIPKATPFKFPLRPGNHIITLQKDGFQTVTRSVQV